MCQKTVKCPNVMDAICIDPLDLSLCNIYTGEHGGDKTNVNKAEDIGNSLMKSYEQNLPEGFRKPLSSSVIPMTNNKKEIVEMYNTELIFARVSYLLSIGRIETKDFFDYELSPIPESLFEQNGDPRYPTNKSDLKNALKVEVSCRNVIPDAPFY